MNAGQEKISSSSNEINKVKTPEINAMNGNTEQKTIKDENYQKKEAKENKSQQMSQGKSDATHSEEKASAQVEALTNNGTTNGKQEIQSVENQALKSDHSDGSDPYTTFRRSQMITQKAEKKSTHANKI